MDANNPPILDGYITKQELAAELRLNARTIDRFTKQGMPFTKLGARKLFRVQAIKEWLLQNEA